MRRVLGRTMAAMSACAWLGACAAPEGPPTVHAPAGAYARAFEAARETLREYRFPVERVDAASGVITAGPRSSPGLFAPWDRDQQTPSRELDDAINLNARVVRVTFAPTAEGAAPEDLRTYEGALEARVEVRVFRRTRPGWRASIVSVTRSPTWRDPLLERRGMGDRFMSGAGTDGALAARLAERIRRRLEPTGG